MGQSGPSVVFEMSRRDPSRIETFDDHFLVSHVKMHPEAIRVVDHNTRKAAWPQHAAKLSEDRVWLRRMMQHSRTMHEVDGRGFERQFALARVELSDSG
jgi:hypothetical protein